MKNNIDKKWIFKRTLFFIGYTALMLYLYKQKDVWIWWFGLGYFAYFIYPILSKIDTWLNEKAKPKNPYPVDEEFLRRLYPNGKPKEERISLDDIKKPKAQKSYSNNDKDEEEYWAREEEYIRYEASQRAWDNMNR